MAERCNSQDISSFVTVMNQSQAFGTPISDALRVYSAEMRDKRVMRAEEAANKLPTKMTLATMMLTVPPLLIILVGPSVALASPSWATCRQPHAISPVRAVPGTIAPHAAGRLFPRAASTPSGSTRPMPGRASSRAPRPWTGSSSGHRLMEAGEYELALRKPSPRAAGEKGLTVDVLSRSARPISASGGSDRPRAAAPRHRQRRVIPETWNNLGVVLMERGEYAEASRGFSPRLSRSTMANRTRIAIICAWPSQKFEKFGL